MSWCDCFAANAEKPFGASIVIENVVYGSGMAASKKNAKAAAGVTSFLSPVTLALIVNLNVFVFLPAAEQALAVLIPNIDKLRQGDAPTTDKKPIPQTDNEFTVSCSS